MNKKRIAIIGNSYGDCTGYYNQYTKNLGLGWPEFLMKNDNFEVTNFCETDASLWFCYQLSLKHHNNFDNILFLVSNASGVTIDSLNLLKDENKEYKHWTKEKVQLFKILNKDVIGYKHYRIIEAISNYYNYVEFIDYVKDCATMLLNNLKLKIPNITFIPCFDDNVANSTCMPLERISNKEIIFLFNNQSIDDCMKQIHQEQLVDIRKCKMTEENNYIFYKKISNYLQYGNLELHIDDFENPKCDLTYYWKKANA